MHAFVCKLANSTCLHCLYVYICFKPVEQNIAKVECEKGRRTRELL